MCALTACARADAFLTMLLAVLDFGCSFPNSGRIIMAQISSGTAVLCSFFVLRVLPADPDWWLTHMLALSTTGFLISWNASATNK